MARVSSDYSERRRYIFDLKSQRRYDLARSEIKALRDQGYQGLALDVDEADVLARLDRPAEALEILERHPSSALPDYGLALLAGLLDKAGRSGESEAIFEELAGRPQLLGATGRRVLLYLEQKDPQRAVNLARRLADDTPAGQLSLARTLQKAEQRQEALAVLEAAVERFPHDDALVKEHVMALLNDLSPGEQVSELETMLSTQKYRGNPHLKERLLQAYRKTDRNQQAKQLLMELLEKNPNNDYLRSNLAYVLRDLGEIDLCLDLLEQVLEVRTESKEALNAYFSTCSKNDRKDRAAAFVAAVTQKNPARRPLWGTLKKYFPR